MLDWLGLKRGMLLRGRVVFGETPDAVGRGVSKLLPLLAGGRGKGIESD